MNHTITYLPKSEVEIRVVIVPQEFEPHLKRAAVLLSEEHNIEGFRRGKAPYDIVKGKFGEMAIYERAAEIVVRKTYPEALDALTKEGKISSDTPPIGKPDVSVTKLAPGNEMQYVVKVALLPHVELPDYRAIAMRIVKEKHAVTVEDTEVKKALEWLRESRSERVAVARPAKEGDAVEVDFEIRHDGVKIEHGDSRNHPVVIGKGKFLPGFEDALIGMKEGEEKSFSLVAPFNWHEKSLAGKALDMKVVMKGVKERRLPEFDDEFVKRMGNFDSLDALKKNIREGMAQEKEEKEKERVRVLAIEAIAKDVAVELPEVLVAAELKKMFSELETGVVRMGMRLEEYLRHIKKTAEDLEKEWRDQAENRVRVALCLREIARRERIEPSREEIEARANEFLRSFKSADDAEKTIDPGELYEYSRGVVRNEKVFEFLEKHE